MEFNSVVLDSSAIIAYYNTEDQNHAEAMRVSEAFQNKTAVLHPFVVQIEKDVAFFQRVGKKISFTDTTLVRLAKEMNAPLFTFDRQMLSLLRNMR